MSKCTRRRGECLYVFAAWGLVFSVGRELGLFDFVVNTNVVRFEDEENMLD